MMLHRRNGIHQWAGRRWCCSEVQWSCCGSSHSQELWTECISLSEANRGVNTSEYASESFPVDKLLEWGDGGWQCWLGWRRQKFEFRVGRKESYMCPLQGTALRAKAAKNLINWKSWNTGIERGQSKVNLSWKFWSVPKKTGKTSNINVREKQSQTAVQ